MLADWQKRVSNEFEWVIGGNVWNWVTSFLKPIFLNQVFILKTLRNNILLP